MKRISRKGIGLVEVAVGTSIIFIGILALTSTFNGFLNYSISRSKSVQAGLLMEEGFEVVKFLRDTSWSTHIAPLVAGTDYSLSFNGAAYSISSGSAPLIDGEFERIIQINPVNRDENHDIAEVGTNDPNTKLVTVTVSYPTSAGTSTQSASTYITNIFDN